MHLIIILIVQAQETKTQGDKEAHPMALISCLLSTNTPFQSVQILSPHCSEDWLGVGLWKGIDELSTQGSFPRLQAFSLFHRGLLGECRVGLGRMGNNPLILMDSDISKIFLL